MKNSAPIMDQGTKKSVEILVGESWDQRHPSERMWLLYFKNSYPDFFRKGCVNSTFMYSIHGELKWNVSRHSIKHSLRMCNLYFEINSMNHFNQVLGKGRESSIVHESLSVCLVHVVVGAIEWAGPVIPRVHWPPAHAARLFLYTTAVGGEGR